LGAHLDVRGDSGYVVAPPSMHGSGRRYVLLFDRPLAPLPPKWLDAMVERGLPAAVGARRQLPKGLAATAYGRAALEGLCAEMLSTPEGSRNDRLVRLSYRAGRLAAAGELAGSTVGTVLVAAAVLAGLDEDEAVDVFGRGFEAGYELPAARTR
jgi:hypothetical protein